jgi:two-component system sensor histidine kinase GlrK
LLVAVVWAMFNLDRLAAQSERLVATGVAAAENSRLLTEQLTAFERSARQHVLIGTEDTLELLRADLETVNMRFGGVRPLARTASVDAELESIREAVQLIGDTLADPQVGTEEAEAVIAQFAEIREQTSLITTTITDYVDNELLSLQESIRDAQRISAWQVAALVPGTLFLVLTFTLLVAKPIRQIDTAIQQLGESGFSRAIAVKGPRDLERLGRQLEWLRVRLLEIAQEKNKFLRQMSHELKTPLASIREGTELLLDGSVGELDNPQREVTNILRTSGIKLQRLIENLLSFSAWQAKSEVLSLRDFPIRALVIAVAQEQRLALHAGEIQLKVDVEDIVVNADRDKMRTVLDNLLSNAIKFTPSGGFVTIRGRETTEGFTIEFADTGPGIPAEEQPRIFEAFFQGRREQGGFVAGTGIGLSVVMECVQAHDGTVELVNSSEFPGAHFKISIPQHRGLAEQKMAANA